MDYSLALCAKIWDEAKLKSLISSKIEGFQLWRTQYSKMERTYLVGLYLLLLCVVVSQGADCVSTKRVPEAGELLCKICPQNPEGWPTDSPDLYAEDELLYDPFMFNPDKPESDTNKACTVECNSTTQYNDGGSRCMKCVGNTFLNTENCTKSGDVCYFDSSLAEGSGNVNPCSACPLDSEGRHQVTDCNG
jgi:hypothetical protein